MLPHPCQSSHVHTQLCHLWLAFIHTVGMIGLISVLSHCPALYPLVPDRTYSSSEMKEDGQELREGHSWYREGTRDSKARLAASGLWLSRLMMAAHHHCLEVPSGSSKSLGFRQAIPCAVPSSAPQKLHESGAVPWAHDLFKPQSLAV